MKCVICRSGETRPRTAVLVLERGELTMVLTKVPAGICENCREEYVDEAAAAAALQTAERAAQEGVRDEIRDFAAA